MLILFCINLIKLRTIWLIGQRELHSFLDRGRTCRSGWAFGSNRTVRFGSSVSTEMVRFFGFYEISVLKKQEPIGSFQIWEPRKFGSVLFGSVPVYIRSNRSLQSSIEKTRKKKERIRISKEENYKTYQLNNPELTHLSVALWLHSLSSFVPGFNLWLCSQAPPSPGSTPVLSACI